MDADANVEEQTGTGVGDDGDHHGGDPRFADLAAAPDPADGGYYAVIFTSQEGADQDGYGETAQHLRELAAEQPGYVGFETATGPDGFGISVSYWATEADGRAWKKVAEHARAQRQGRERWYDRYTVRVARVERHYGWARGAGR